MGLVICGFWLAGSERIIWAKFPLFKGKTWLPSSPLLPVQPLASEKTANLVDLVSLDFAEVVYSTNYLVLLAKLKSFYITGNVLNKIQSYLSGRSCQVQIGGVVSD